MAVSPPRASSGTEPSVGHWTSDCGRTGCTVVIFGEGSVASGEVRGGAPATREFALLDPRRMVEHVDAVVLSGGSAFGLATSDGVMRWLAEQGRGFETRSGPVPIVVGMSLFDLDPEVTPPGADQGRAAAQAATADAWPFGRVGAGAGATVGKWRGPDHAEPGGLGYAVTVSGGVEVHALIAVNAVGEINDGTLVSTVQAGDYVSPTAEDADPTSFENTTIGVLWTNAGLDKVACRLVAESGHDGLARALIPAHTRGDGDALVAVSIGNADCPLPTVRLLASVAVEEAIRSLA